MDSILEAMVHMLNLDEGELSLESISGLDLSSWSGFWQTFRLPVLVSLLGALIGHYAKSGVIQLPIFVIPYTKGRWIKKFEEGNEQIWKWIKAIIVFLFIIIDFIRFLLGFRKNEHDSGKRIYIELGFLGDILIGAGTGILAKTAVELMGSGNIFNEISTAFIAGFAGLSYIRERQNKELGLDGGSDDSNRKLDPGKVVMLREDWPGDTKGNTGQEKPKAETTKDSQEKQ